MSENNLVLQNQVLHEEIIKNMRPIKKGRPRKDEISEKHWEDPEYRKQYHRSYYHNIMKDPKNVLTCECGVNYCRLLEKQHCQSKYHIHYFEIKNKLIVERVKQ